MDDEELHKEAQRKFQEETLAIRQWVNNIPVDPAQCPAPQDLVNEMEHWIETICELIPSCRSKFIL